MDWQNWYVTYAVPTGFMFQMNSAVIHLTSLTPSLNGYSEKKKAVRHNDGKWITMVKNDISDPSRKIRGLKEKLKLCDAVVISSDRVTESVDSRGNDIGRLNEIPGTIIKNEEVKKHGS